MKKVFFIIVCGVLGYFSYTFNEKNAKCRIKIDDYKMEIQKIKNETAVNEATVGEQKTDEIINNNCSQIVKESKYVIEGSGNDGSNGGPITEKTSITFHDDGKATIVSGTAANGGNYLMMAM